MLIENLCLQRILSCMQSQGSTIIIMHLYEISLIKQVLSQFKSFIAGFECSSIFWSNKITMMSNKFFKKIYQKWLAWMYLSTHLNMVIPNLSFINSRPFLIRLLEEIHPMDHEDVVEVKEGYKVKVFNANSVVKMVI